MTDYQPHYADSYALLMGIDAYKRLAPLSAAVRGAEHLAAVLEDNFGFKVTLLKDRHVTREAVFDWLDMLAHDAGPDDRVVIYFAGHGLTRGLGAYERGYLGLVDTVPGKWHTTLPMDDIIDETRFVKAKHLLYLLDCCFGGLALDTRAAPDIPREVGYYLTRPVRYVITAGGKEVVDDALAPDFEHSLFAHHLLEWLGGKSDIPPGGIWRARELGNYLERAIARNRRSGHKPNHNYLPGSGDGDFVFYWEEEQGFVTQGLSSAMHSTSWQVRQGAVGALIEMAQSDDRGRAAYARNWLVRIAQEDENEQVRAEAQQYLDRQPVLEDDDTQPIFVPPVIERPAIKPAERTGRLARIAARWWQAALVLLATLVLALRFVVTDTDLFWLDFVYEGRYILVLVAGLLFGAAGAGCLARRRWLRGAAFVAVTVAWVVFVAYDAFELYGTWLDFLEAARFLPFVLTAGALLWALVGVILDRE
jgi:hypothetical protein